MSILPLLCLTFFSIIHINLIALKLTISYIYGLFVLKFWINQFVAGVAELVDALDLKSSGTFLPCRFESGPRYTILFSKTDWLLQVSELETFFGFLAQLVRVSAWRAGSQWFESTRTHKLRSKLRFFYIMET